MSRKDAINNLFLKRPEASGTATPRGSERVRTGAISAMGASLQEMSENAKQAAQLQKQLAEGDAIVSIDPKKIDHSRITDRIPTEVDLAFDQLVASIAENGQQVPVLVRPSPDTPGRYQIAYGRRRLRAAEKLGLGVKAIVRNLSDSDLIVAQGRENLDRKDLSFIEKAFFARNLEDDGCDRHTIISALATDKADISRYIAVARRMPDVLVKKIGPAPKSGRARWLALADKLEQQAALATAERALDDPSLRSADSDTRFDAVLNALQSRKPKVRPSIGVWKAPGGKRGARIEAKDGRTALVFEEKTVPEFAHFVAGKLDDLFNEFQANGSGGEKP
ncbi:plasmid partitioning protein RepB [Mesorhizobium australicum]|uniref:Chromosome partitioning protein, ParB family n=1 Tax=Mesorhizobium australicum TaxID=536018 RepID=A0A1X7MR48_9HYPH|nr:plasmid partitioning protein RepB [Mesorhizobium australicum]SMH26597.1 chromosome partitioning protein, ParB family [Mesorhizobium australicum]